MDLRPDLVFLGPRMRISELTVTRFYERTSAAVPCRRAAFRLPDLACCFPRPRVDVAKESAVEPRPRERAREAPGWHHFRLSLPTFLFAEWDRYLTMISLLDEFN
jgi:hypothetical protein